MCTRHGGQVVVFALVLDDLMVVLSQQVYLGVYHGVFTATLLVPVVGDQDAPFALRADGLGVG
jgi:hypothetical protein